MKIILASKSPRRKELLSYLTKDFEIIESNFDEDSINSRSPKGLVRRLAKGKCGKVYTVTQGNRCVIGADSIVAIDDRVLGKPKDKQDAVKMLKSLSGRPHKVLTGVCIKICEEDIETEISFVCSSTVYFSELDDEQIASYVASGEPMDKAGAYAIQGLGGRFIKKISGSFHNIVGLPIAQLYEVLVQEGIINK